MTFRASSSIGRYRRLTNILAAAYCAAIAVLSCFIVWNRTADMKRNLQHAIISGQQLSQQSHSISQRLQAISNHEAVQLDELRQIRQRIPTALDEAGLLEEVALCAEQCAVTIEQFVPVGNTADDNSCRAEVRISARANYAGCCRFLHRLQDLQRMCDIRELHMSAESPDSDRQHMALSLGVYHVVPAAVANGPQGAMQ